MPGQLNGAVGVVFLAYCDWWLTSTPERGREKHLVRILEKQLDRCGPDQWMRCLPPQRIGSHLCLGCADRLLNKMPRRRL